MVSVGVVSTLFGGRAILTVPAMFVTFMAVGGATGILLGGAIPKALNEFGIAASVLVLGAMMCSASDTRLNPAPIAATTRHRVE